MKLKESIPRFYRKRHKNFFILLMIFALIVNYIAFITRVHHYHFGLFFIVLAAISYRLYLKYQKDDLYVFIFWALLISGVFAFLIDIKDVFIFISSL